MWSFDALVAFEFGCENGFQNSASQKRALHRIGGLAGLEHFFDRLHQAREMLERLALLEPHERGHGLGASFHFYGGRRVLGNAVGHERRRFEAVAIPEAERIVILSEL